MNFNKVSFKIIPILKLKDKPQVRIVWEQVRTIIDDHDILDTDDDFHWGMESFSFLNYESEYYKGKMLIGVCTCSIEGCVDIVAEIDSSEDYVSWKVFHEKEPGEYKYYTFNKTDYMKAIEVAKSKVTQKEKFVYEE